MGLISKTIFLLVLSTSCGSGSKKTEESSSAAAEKSSSSIEKSSSSPTSLKIAAFNADVLGKTKMGKSNIAGYIADIITRYDVILIQEVRDVDEQTPTDLLNLVNAKGKGTYALSASERLGRTSSKEQYVFYYKEDSGLKVEKAEVYDDTSDAFEREPYLVNFSSGTTSFALIGIHVKPDDAVKELNQLDDVYTFATSEFPKSEPIVLGDLNIDCSYVSDSEYETLDFKSQGFTFEIAKTLDTTVSSTDCAYDNIVSKSKNISNVSIFDFETAYGLDQSTAEAVSNHFPVEFDLAFSK